MNILENTSLSAYSTMRLGGKTRYLANAQSDQDIVDLIAFARQKRVDFLMIGQGSNIIWKDEGYSGLVIVNKILGKKIVIQDQKGAIVKLAAGENWDSVVEWTISQSLGGLELLSKIPGSVGAAPVQNIGAYGAELSDLLLEVQAYDCQTNSFGSIANSACDFGYRTSRFKKQDRGRFLITGITVKLHKKQPQPPFYESLQEYIEQNHITDLTHQTIRQAVTAIRSVKLPDPSVVANNGSFFINPIVNQLKLDELKQNYPDIKFWPMSNGQIKLSAGWMVERAGFKGFYDDQTGMGTWPNSALVVINKSTKSTNDLLTFKNKITGKVQEMFGIILEQEPQLLP